MKKAMRKHKETMLQLPNAAAKNTINNQCLMTKVIIHMALYIPVSWLLAC